MAGNEDSALVLWGAVGVLLCLIGWLVWMTMKVPLTEGLLLLRRGEIAVASLWVDPNQQIPVYTRERPVEYDPLTHHEMERGEVVVKTSYVPFSKVRDMAQKATAQQVIAATGFVPVLTQAALEPYRWIFGVIFLGLAWWAVNNAPNTIFRRKLTFETLIGAQAEAFKTCEPFVKFNPLKLAGRAIGAPVPDKLPSFSEALSPEEFVAHHRLLPEDQAGGAKKNRVVPHDLAVEAFKKQLLGPWKGWQDLPAPVQVLLAGFALKAARKRDEADAFLGRLICCWSFENGMRLNQDSKLLSEARAILKSKDAEPMLKICQRHAYITTALLRALQFAREEGGVLPPSAFVWLRAYNRTLWYPLNNVGRQAFHTEAAGAMSHFRVEKMVGRPVVKPMVDDAIRGLNEHLASPIFSKPIPGTKAA